MTHSSPLLHSDLLIPLLSPSSLSLLSSSHSSHLTPSSTHTPSPPIPPSPSLSLPSSPLPSPLTLTLTLHTPSLSLAVPAPNNQPKKVARKKNIPTIGSVLTPENSSDMPPSIPLPNGIKEAGSSIPTVTKEVRTEQHSAVQYST